MNNLEELTLKIEKIISDEKAQNPDIQYLDISHAPLIAQIISNYNLKPSQSDFPNAEMIFLGAPTGSGKDTLVKKIESDNPNKNFVTLNMDIFRYYHNELSQDQEYISDKEYALKTNQTSYELYYIIQEIILKEFPGTNIIVTGTMRDLEWVREIITRYKTDLQTQYSTSLATLAVPVNESAFSIFERYLSMVNEKGFSNTPLRYTDLTYHNDTVKKFLSNIYFFEEEFHKNTSSRLFDNIKVYRRNNDIYDTSEDTLVYDSSSNNAANSNKCAFAHINEIMYSSANISESRINRLLDIIKQNSKYLKSQNLYNSIIMDLKKVLSQFDKTSKDIPQY